MTKDQDAQAPFEAVAVVGLAGRFPRARNLDEFWQKLAAGEELVTFFSDEELAASGISPELLSNPSYIKARAVLEDADLFDASFFGINPREAELIDPQQRLFLECAWEALENAGYDAGRYPGAIGVYAGSSMNSYLFNNLARNPSVVAAAGGYQLMLASDKDFLATRAAYKLDLRGPAVTIQTACSTSLVAVQMACQSLLAYQCDMALAGGVSVSSPRASGYLYQPGMIMSPDGHCRAFDARGRGIVAGEGVGLVVLKRLSEALADGDTIHAIIKGAAINNDGALKVGFTAPSVDGQAEVIALAQATAGIAPDTIGYVEAHGTGTELGDPIEVAALSQAFAAGPIERNTCALGSVKTNIGHLDAAAGVAGLLKTVLALEHRQIPPSLHFEKPNPNIDFAGSVFYVNASLQDWAPRPDAPRRAGVSSFGIGGTNAHVVLEEAVPISVSRSTRPSQLVLLSARSSAALEQATDALVGHLHAHPELDLADVAHTLQVGRKPFGERRAVVVSAETSQAIATLEERDPRRVADASSALRNRPVAFLFPGQGAQHVHMARELYTAEPLFRAEVDRCADLLRPHLGLDLRQVLFPEPGHEDEASQQLVQTALAQPALFVVEYSLARLWMSWGVEPRAMLGHSIGEYVAACLAGVFSLDDVLALVAARGKLMQDVPGGDMLAVPLSELELVAELDTDLSIAAVNGPRLCVVSGPSTSVQALRERLEARGITCRPLHTSHAFHSAMMEPVLEAFSALVGQVVRHAPELPYVSNLTGTWITPEQATDPAYWAAHLRSTVRFADGAAILFDDPTTILLEVGPGLSLSSLLKLHAARPADLVAVASMRHPQDPTPDHTVLLTALGRLWLAGAKIDWPGVHAPECRKRVPLPTYPFERQRFWVEPQVASSFEAAPDEPRLLGFPGRREDLGSWFYQPSWRRVDRAARLAETLPEGLPEQDWLVFDDGLGLGTRLLELLADRRQRVIRVLPGQSFACESPVLYHLPPADRDGYDALLRDLKKADRLPGRIVHLWNLGPATPDDLSPDAIQRAQASAFYSLVYLAQALGDHGGFAPVQIDVVGNGVFDVLGDEPLIASKATLLGPCRVIPQEYLQIGCRYIDVRLPDAEVDSRLAATVWAELQTPIADVVVAHRGNHRWLQTFEHIALEQQPAGSTLLRKNGVYLITGGLGGVGLAVAEYLARTVQARLALTGRGQLPERPFWSAWQAEHGPDNTVSRRIRSLQELEELGAEVLVVRADVADAGQMRDAIGQVRARFGKIDGVVHAAGVAGGGIIGLKTPALAERVLAPKVRGTAVLAEALEGESLDFFALCSSFTALLGGAGQVDYCSANAFQDAFAHAQTRQGKCTIAINWSVWQEVGMAVDTVVAPHLQEVKDTNVRNGMHTLEGQEAFGRILANPLPQIVVSTQDLPALVAWYDRLLRSAETDVQQAPVSSISPSVIAPVLHARPLVTSAYAAPRTEREHQLAEVWQTLLGIADIGVNDSFFDLGGHSLLATQLLARLQRLYGVDVPLRTIFESQTIAELAERIETIQWAADARPHESMIGTEDREEIEL